MLFTVKLDSKFKEKEWLKCTLVGKYIACTFCFIAFSQDEQTCGINWWYFQRRVLFLKTVAPFWRIIFTTTFVQSTFVETFLIPSAISSSSLNCFSCVGFNQQTEIWLHFWLTTTLIHAPPINFKNKVL